MDSLLHFVQGALLTSLISEDVTMIATGGCIGIIPDLVGYLDKYTIKTEKLYDGILTKISLSIIYKSNQWDAYNFAHSLSFINPLVYFPQSLLHILLDKPFHTKQLKWWMGKGIKYEIGAWILTLVLIWMRL